MTGSRACSEMGFSPFGHQAQRRAQGSVRISAILTLTGLLYPLCLDQFLGLFNTGLLPINSSFVHCVLTIPLVLLTIGINRSCCCQFQRNFYPLFTPLDWQYFLFHGDTFTDCFLLSPLKIPKKKSVVIVSLFCLGPMTDLGCCKTSYSGISTIDITIVFFFWRGLGNGQWCCGHNIWNLERYACLTWKSPCRPRERVSLWVGEQGFFFPSIFNVAK